MLIKCYKASHTPLISSAKRNIHAVQTCSCIVKICCHLIHNDSSSYVHGIIHMVMKFNIVDDWLKEKLHVKHDDCFKLTPKQELLGVSQIIVNFAIFC